MNDIGSLQLAWVNGYRGNKAEYINQDVICFKCGDNIKFVGEDGHDSMYSAPSGISIGPLAVHGVNKLFAYSENAIKPRIYVLQYPSFLKIATLEAGAQLEYLTLTFSTSDYMASVSGVPDYQLIIWRYADHTKLYVQEFPHMTPNCVCFNPGNWRQLAICTNKELTIWNVEQNNTTFLLKKQCHIHRLPERHFQGQHKLPSGTPTSIREEPTSRSSIRKSRVTMHLPLSAVAGVMGDDVTKFEDYLDEVDRMVPINLCWLSSGDLLASCADGQLIKIDIENCNLTVLSFVSMKPETVNENSKEQMEQLRDHADNDNKTNPNGKQNEGESGTPESKQEKEDEETKDSSKDKKGSDDSKDRNEKNKVIVDESKDQAKGEGKEEAKKDVGDSIQPGAFNCMALHRRGIFVAGNDGVLRILQITNDQYSVVEYQKIGSPITSISFNPSHHSLALGSSKGSIHLCDPDSLLSLRLLFDIHHGNFIAVCGLPAGSDCCVTLRESGEVQVWKSETGRLVSSLSIGVKSCCMAASPLVHMVVVGGETGYVYIVDLTKLDHMRIVHVIHLHQTPILCITFNQVGQFFLTGSTDGSVIVVDGRPSKQFEPLGYINCPGEVKGLALFMTDGETKVVVTSDVSETHSSRSPANKLISFSLPADLLQDVKSKHASLKCDFMDEITNRLCFNFPEPVYGIALIDDVIFALSQSNKHLQKYLLPLKVPKKERKKDPYLVVSEHAAGHQLTGGCLSLSPHCKWIASGGGDGQLILRTTETLDQRTNVRAHNYWIGGVLSFTFSPDAQFIFTSGYDGILCCFKWNYTPAGISKGQDAAFAAASLMARLLPEQVAEDKLLMYMSDWNQEEPQPKIDKEQKTVDVEKEIEKAIENDMIYIPSSPAPPDDATWQDVKRIEAQKEEEKKFAEEKMKLRTEIRDMRRTLQQMMRENESVPQIEKLPHHEFDLDVDEQRRIQELCEVEVQKLHEEKEFQNIAKMYLTEIIRKECWDDMMVKGRGIVSFNTNLEVYNYPMKERTRLEERELEVVEAQRRIEIAELQARKDIAAAMSKAPKDPANLEEEPVETEEVKLQLMREKSAITGSLGFEIGGDSELFYSQFELCTREQKQNQIILLQDAIYRIRMRFNKDFDEVFQRKEQEILKIKEKNKRIRKILEDLNLPEEVNDPEMGLVEKPEMLLTTNDDEVKVEKYLTPEQWKKMEEDRKYEEERRLKERGDNWRERGLDQMMGGVLEIKKEDELKKDIPIPLFMQEKKEEEWSVEERKAAEEYKLKVRELEEERDRFRKQLELELKKLQTVVLEGTQAFDDVLYQLFMKKVKTESVIFQEELKILRLRYSLLTEEELMNYEKELIHKLDTVKHSAQLATALVNESKRQLEDYRNEYDIHLADDKVHERMFRREFQNLPAPLVDQLFKHYKRRPRGQKAKTFDSPAYDSSSSNLFADRPPSATRSEEARAAMLQAMAELNHEKNIPEAVDNQTWERLCAYRMEKIEKEQQLKQEVLILAEMQAYVQKRQEEEDKLKLEIEIVIEAISKLHDSRQIFNTDLEVQFLLKQGQVEVDPGPFIPNYKYTLLIHREVVEELNKKIRQLGESKIASMVESKDFRKGIIVLEWEHKKMKMEMEDLKNRMRDINNMKVTREIQAYLACDNYDALKNQELTTLEQTIAMQKKHHEQCVKEKRKALKAVKRSILQMVDKNSELEAELDRLNVTVNERRHIQEVNPGKLQAIDREERYRDIVQRRKLVDLAKAQAQEIAMLRTELERLRMRTFPALVQLDH